MLSRNYLLSTHGVPQATWMGLQDESTTTPCHTAAPLPARPILLFEVGDATHRVTTLQITDRHVTGQDTQGTHHETLRSVAS